MIVPRSQRTRTRFASTATVFVAWACSAYAADSAPSSGEAFLKVLLTQQVAQTPSNLLQTQTIKTEQLNRLKSLPVQTPATLRHIGHLEVQLAQIEQKATNQAASLQQKSARLSSRLAALELVQPTNPKQALQIKAQERSLRGSIWVANYQANVYGRVAGTPTR